MKDWPHFPEDQLALFDLPEPTQVDKTERPTRVKGPLHPDTSECPVCHTEKTRGLPCPICAAGTPGEGE